MTISREDALTDILSDEGISKEVQEYFSRDELYDFAEDIFSKRDVSLEDVLDSFLYQKEV